MLTVRILTNMLHLKIWTCQVRDMAALAWAGYLLALTRTGNAESRTVTC